MGKKFVVVFEQGEDRQYRGFNTAVTAVRAAEEGKRDGYSVVVVNTENSRVIYF